jgi:WD40 repeat protein
LDGTSRLWDVGSDKQLRSFDSQGFSGVNCIALDTQGKLLTTGLGSGMLEIWDLAAGRRIHQINRMTFPRGDAPNASDRWTQEVCGGISALDVNTGQYQILSGTTNGVLTLYDQRTLSSIINEGDVNVMPTLANWKRNGATINDVKFIDDKSSEVIVATSDGTPYRLGLDHGGIPHVIDEYCGWDVDNVEAIAFDHNNRVWLAGSEGNARQY